VRTDRSATGQAWCRGRQRNCRARKRHSQDATEKESSLTTLRRLARRGPANCEISHNHIITLALLPSPPVALTSPAAIQTAQGVCEVAAPRRVDAREAGRWQVVVGHGRAVCGRAWALPEDQVGRKRRLRWPRGRKWYRASTHIH